MYIFNYKTPRGTIDLFNEDVNKLNHYKNYLTELFIKYNGVELETPVFELRENLLNKYGYEVESKLVYNLEENGSEQAEKYTLRYDLTVPKARYVLANGIKKARIYSIGKVYRRDNPSLGRYREFYQADFDIFGESSATMLNEVLMFKMVNEFMIKASKPNYVILVNYTANLQSILIDTLGIDKSNYKSICSTIDKLDKINFDELVKEFKSKGLTNDQIVLLKELIQMPESRDNSTLKNINQIINLTDKLGFSGKIKYCASLARGLDYYNGIIFEVKLVEQDFSSSIISGGRYDGMVGDISSIGISFGLSRLMPFLSWKPEKFQEKYYITTLDHMSLEDKFNWIKIIESKLNINCIFSSEHKDKKLVKVINDCLKDKIRYLIILASRELSDGKIIIKDLENSTQSLVDITK